MSNIFKKFPSHESIDSLSEKNRKQFSEKFEIMSEADFEIYITSHHEKPPAYHYGSLLSRCYKYKGTFRDARDMFKKGI